MSWFQELGGPHESSWVWRHNFPLAAMVCSIQIAFQTYERAIHEQFDSKNQQAEAREAAGQVRVIQGEALAYMAAGVVIVPACCC